jgi:hypothetical protein
MASRARVLITDTVFPSLRPEHAVLGELADLNDQLRAR